MQMLPLTLTQRILLTQRLIVTLCLTLTHSLKFTEKLSLTQNPYQRLTLIQKTSLGKGSRSREIFRLRKGSRLRLCSGLRSSKDPPSRKYPNTFALAKNHSLACPKAHIHAKTDAYSKDHSIKGSLPFSPLRFMLNNTKLRGENDGPEPVLKRKLSI